MQVDYLVFTSFQTVLFEEYPENGVQKLHIVEAFKLALGVFAEYYRLGLCAVAVDREQDLVALAFVDHSVQKLTLEVVAFLVGNDDVFRFVRHMRSVGLAVAAENIDDLMLDELLDGGAGGL